MLKSKSYILTMEKRKALHTMGVTLICRRCHKPLTAGEVVHKKNTAHSQTYYHEACWQEMFI